MHRLTNHWHGFDLPTGGGDGGVERQQRAGPAIQISPPHPTTTAVGRSARARPVAPQNRSVRPAAPAADVVACDGSDLDISDSLPQDENSPVLGPRTAGPASPPQPKAQPVYAVVKKKKKPTNEDSTRIGAKASSRTHQHPDMTDSPRSPAKIPLIRISQTESLEQADSKLGPDDPLPKHQQVNERVHVQISIKITNLYEMSY